MRVKEYNCQLNCSGRKGESAFEFHFLNFEFTVTFWHWDLTAIIFRSNYYRYSLLEKLLVWLSCHCLVAYFILFSCFWYGPWYLFPTLPLCMCKQFFVCLIVPSWSILIGWKKIMANSFQSLKKKKKRGVKLIVISKGQISLVKWFYSDVPSFHLKYRVGGWKSDEIKNILGY